MSSDRQKRRLAQREVNRMKRRMIEKVYTNNYAFNLNCLVDGWLELESDPATFSLLIEDFGCIGAQVEEIYDLEQKFESPVFGFIFLFKWLVQQNDSTRSRERKSLSNQQNNSTSSSGDKIIEQQKPDQGQWSYVEDEDKINEMFFAKQMISNSCATHALISILLNCDFDELHLGPTLTRLKEHTQNMDPVNRGYAIGNLPEVTKAHNSHASYSSLYNSNKPSHSASGMSYLISGNQRTNSQQHKKHEAYHFVSYVPIKNRLYELDGLKNYPIDHGPLDPKKDWTDRFKEVIKQRLANKSGDDPTVSNDIRYNLMAVVPDKRLFLRSKLKRLKAQYEIVKQNMERLTKRTYNSLSIDSDIPNPPYSPLSNSTLTASESDNYPDSPSTIEGTGSLSDDECGIDKYFFVKFNQNTDDNPHYENMEPAHRSCNLKIETTDQKPLNLKLGTKEETKPVDSESERHTTDTAAEDESEPSLSKGSSSLTNGLTDIEESLKSNEVSAHGDELYNLSAKPPFEFNIMDEMQHVHLDKTILRDMRDLSDRLKEEIDKVQSALRDELDKRRKYKVENSRRTHNYEPFIVSFLSLLATQGKLADSIERDLGIVIERDTEPATKITKPTTQSSTPKSTQPSISKTSTHKTAQSSTPKPKYKYVSTGRPVGRPRKNPLPQ